jgi:hypothetical protein
MGLRTGSEPAFPVFVSEWGSFVAASDALHGSGGCEAAGKEE